MPKPPNPELARKILAIALEELGSSSPDQVNMRRIAARAGVSPTAIYYYFSSKAALFERIKFDAMDELEARIQAELDPASPPRARLAALIRCYAAWCIERPHLARLLMEALPAKTELDAEAMKRYYATFLRAQAIVEEAVADGSLSRRDILLDVSLAQAAIWGIASQFLSKRVHPDYWGSIEPLIDRFIELYFGDPGGGS